MHPGGRRLRETSALLVLIVSTSVSVPSKGLAASPGERNAVDEIVVRAIAVPVAPGTGRCSGRGALEGRSALRPVHPASSGHGDAGLGKNGSPHRLYPREALFRRGVLLQRAGENHRQRAPLRPGPHVCRGRHLRHHARHLPRSPQRLYVHVQRVGSAERVGLHRRRASLEPILGPGVEGGDSGGVRRLVGRSGDPLQEPSLSWGRQRVGYQPPPIDYV